MKRYVLALILCLLPIFLISCATIGENKGKEQKAEWDYGKLVFMGGECVAWFSPDLNLIGPSDMKEYFQKNKLEPTEPKVLNHFASLGWEVVTKTRKDKYTTEYQLKREKTKSYVSD